MDKIVVDLPINLVSKLYKLAHLYRLTRDEMIAKLIADRVLEINASSESEESRSQA